MGWGKGGDGKKGKPHQEAGCAACKTASSREKMEIAQEGSQRRTLSAAEGKKSWEAGRPQGGGLCKKGPGPQGSHRSRSVVEALRTPGKRKNVTRPSRYHQTLAGGRIWESGK